MSSLTVKVICGFGVGSSTLLKIKVQSILRELGVEAAVFTGDISAVTEGFCDVIFTTKDLGERIKSEANVPVVTINNIMDSVEIRGKVEEFLESKR